MEIKDIAVSVERMEAVRGGNTIAQSNYVGGVVSAIGVGGGNFNGSPVSVTSGVLQQNVTNQLASIHDVDVFERSVRLDGSQVSFGGFPLFRTLAD